MPALETITYLRTGRTLRASGKVVDRYANGSLKIKPVRDDWKHVIVTKGEIDAGSERPPSIARKKPEGEKPKREKKPKITPFPRWKQLVNESRNLLAEYQAGDHGRIWDPAVATMIQCLANELEESRTLFQK